MSELPTQQFDVVIIGAGAAGMMCAIEAGERGRRVLLLDRAKKAGKKILISGGGRCNFTNLYAGPENFLSANPHFCKSALARFTPWDFIALLDQHGLSWHEKAQGQLFCDQRAPAIVDMLLSLCEQAGVIVQLESTIHSIEKNNVFTITTSRGKIDARSLVIATGGPSIPRMGATAFSLDVARQFGLATIPFRPALVPLVLSGNDKQLLHGLAGVSLEAVVRCNGQSFRDHILITHKGLSGPAVLQISSYWEPGDAIEIDLLPALDAKVWIDTVRERNPDQQLKTALARLLPRKLAQQLCTALFPDQPIRQFSSDALQQVIATLQSLTLRPTDSEGLRTAEVCLGGVDTAALSSKTMAARDVAGLYFVGESVDVTGQLGGFNFQWAWASGWCAGQYV